MRELILETRVMRRLSVRGGPARSVVLSYTGANPINAQAVAVPVKIEMSRQQAEALVEQIKSIISEISDQ